MILIVCEMSVNVSYSYSPLRFLDLLKEVGLISHNNNTELVDHWISILNQQESFLSLGLHSKKHGLYGSWLVLRKSGSQSLFSSSVYINVNNISLVSSNLISDRVIVGKEHVVDSCKLVDVLLDDVQVCLVETPSNFTLSDISIFIASWVVSRNDNHLLECSPSNSKEAVIQSALSWKASSSKPIDAINSVSSGEKSDESQTSLERQAVNDGVVTPFPKKSRRKSAMSAAKSGRSDVVPSIVETPLRPPEWKCPPGRRLDGLYPHVLHDGELRPIAANTLRPVPFSTDLFDGVVLLMINTHLPSDLYYNRFLHTRYVFEVQVQGRFKKDFPPGGHLFFGIEITKPRVELGLLTRGLCSSLLQVGRAVNPYVHHSFGDRLGLEYPHISAPVWTTVDRLTITPGTNGSKPPPLGLAFPEETEARLKRRGNPEFRCDIDSSSTYSFSFKTSNIDATNWKLVNIPVMKSLDLHSFINDADLILMAYWVPYGSAQSNYGTMHGQYLPKMHQQAQVKYMFKLSLFHGSNHPDWTHSPWGTLETPEVPEEDRGVLLAEEDPNDSDYEERKRKQKGSNANKSGNSFIKKKETTTISNPVDEIKKISSKDSLSKENNGGKVRRRSSFSQEKLEAISQLILPSQDLDSEDVLEFKESITSFDDDETEDFESRDEEEESDENEIDSIDENRSVNSDDENDFSGRNVVESDDDDDLFFESFSSYQDSIGTQTPPTMSTAGGLTNSAIMSGRAPPGSYEIRVKRPNIQEGLIENHFEHRTSQASPLRRGIPITPQKSAIKQDGNNDQNLLVSKLSFSSEHDIDTNKDHIDSVLSTSPPLLHSISQLNSASSLTPEVLASYLAQSLVVSAIELDDRRPSRKNGRRFVYAFRIDPWLEVRAYWASMMKSNQNDDFLEDQGSICPITSDSAGVPHCILRTYREWTLLFPLKKVDPRPPNYSRLSQPEQRRLELEASYRDLLRKGALNFLWNTNFNAGNASSPPQNFGNMNSASGNPIAMSNTADKKMIEKWKSFLIGGPHSDQCCEYTTSLNNNSTLSSALTNAGSTATNPTTSYLSNLNSFYSAGTSTLSGNNSGDVNNNGAHGITKGTSLNWIASKSLRADLPSFVLESLVLVQIGTSYWNEECLGLTRHHLCFLKSPSRLSKEDRLQIPYMSLERVEAWDSCHDDPWIQSSDGHDRVEIDDEVRRKVPISVFRRFRPSFQIVTSSYVSQNVHCLYGGSGFIGTNSTYYTMNSTNIAYSSIGQSLPPPPPPAPSPAQVKGSYLYLSTFSKDFLIFFSCSIVRNRFLLFIQDRLKSAARKVQLPTSLQAFVFGSVPTSTTSISPTLPHPPLYLYLTSRTKTWNLGDRQLLNGKTFSRKSFERRIYYPSDRRFSALLTRPTELLEKLLALAFKLGESTFGTISSSSTNSNSASNLAQSFNSSLLPSSPPSTSNNRIRSVKSMKFFSGLSASSSAAAQSPPNANSSLFLGSPNPKNSSDVSNGDISVSTPDHFTMSSLPGLRPVFLSGAAASTSQQQGSLGSSIGVSNSSLSAGLSSGTGVADDALGGGHGSNNSLNSNSSSNGSGLSLALIPLWREFLDGVALLQAIDLDACNLSPSEKLAFFLNLYHCLLIHGFLVWGLPDSTYQWGHFYSSCAYEGFGDVFSLLELEHCIIRFGMSKNSI